MNTKEKKLEESSMEFMQQILSEAQEHSNDVGFKQLKEVVEGKASDQKEFSPTKKPTPKATPVTLYDDIVDDYGDNIENEEFVSDDFDTPHDIIPLPSKGLIYKSVKSKIPVSYLTASDEDYITSPNLYLDGKIIDLLLNKKILDKSINPLDLCKGDRDAIIVWLYASGYGPHFPISVKDPESGETFSTEANLSKLEFKPFNLIPDGMGYFTFILPKSKDEIKFRFLTHRDELVYSKLLEKMNPNFKKVAVKTSISSIKDIVESEKGLEVKRKVELNKAIESIESYLKTIESDETTLHLKNITFLLERSIVSINGNTDKAFIKSYISAMPVIDSLAIRKHINENTPGVDFNITIERPESLGGGSINTFLEFDSTIFLHVS